MRILWLGHNLAYPPKGGPLQRNYNLLREAAKSCEVHVLAFDQPATRPVGVSREECVRRLSEFCASAEWVPLSQGFLRGNRYLLALRGLASRNPFVIHWLRSSEMVERIRKAVDSIAFDVVHFDTLGLAQYRPLVRWSGTVLNHHDIESSMMASRVTKERNILRRQYWRKQARSLGGAEERWCPRFDVNLVVSEQDEKVLTDSLARIKTRVVPNGVDIDYFRPRADPGGRTLFFCGNLDWYSNSEAMKFFFDAIWPRLTDHLGDVEVYVVGRMPPKWLKLLGAMDDRIHVPGFVEDVRPYFRKATVYVCPITSGGGTRLKILDALAMGVPLIGTSFACSGLSLEKGKHVLIAETPKEFVCQIEQVLSNLILRMSLATAGREIVERVYSWSIIGEKLLEAYEIAALARPIA